MNDFLSGPGSPEDGRVGVGYLIEGRCDCSRFKLEPWSLCSFLWGRKRSVVYKGVVRRRPPAARLCLTLIPSVGSLKSILDPRRGGPSLKRLPIGGPVRRSPGRLPPRPPKKSSLKPVEENHKGFFILPPQSWLYSCVNCLHSILNLVCPASEILLKSSALKTGSKMNVLGNFNTNRLFESQQIKKKNLRREK